MGLNFTCDPGCTLDNSHVGPCQPASTDTAQRTPSTAAGRALPLPELRAAIVALRTELARELHRQFCAPAAWEREVHRVEDYRIVDSLGPTLAELAEAASAATARADQFETALREATDLLAETRARAERAARAEAVVAAARAWLRRNRRWLDDPTAGEEEDHALALAVDEYNEAER